MLMESRSRNSGAAHFLGVGHGRALSPLLQNHISGSDHSAARWHGALYPAAEVVTWMSSGRLTSLLDYSGGSL